MKNQNNSLSNSNQVSNLSNLNPMRNLIVLFAFLISLSVFTSCEQDNDLFDATTEQIAEQMTTPEGADLANEPMENVETFTKTQMPAEITFIDSTQTSLEFATPFELTVEKADGVESRGGNLGCNSSVSGTTFGKTNRFTRQHYSTMGLNANLDGGDDIFNFQVSSNKTVSFDLRNTSSNMGMILFKGEIYCTGALCSYQLTQLVANTTSQSNFGDQINSVFLTPGTYFLIVDAPYGVASNFTLEMICGQLGNPLFTVSDDFNNYYNGGISNQSNYWSKWNNNAYYDGQVTGSYNKYLFIERKNSASTAHQPDVLYRLDEAGNYTYHIDFDLFVNNNRSAYFNLQKQLSYANSSNEFGAQVFFYSNGQGAVKIANRTIPFSYQQNRWLKIKLDIHTDISTTDGAIISINDNVVATFNPRWSSTTSYGSNKLAAIDFYPYASDSQFWVDNIEVKNF